MFAKSTPDLKREAERQAIERAKKFVEEDLEKMKTALPNESERLHDKVKDRCKDKTLPLDFKRQALELARRFDCHANMRATDRLLHDAMRMAVGEHMKERGRMLMEARRLFGKACALGADSEFRKAAERLMDTIMMSGGVHLSGPTRAKPADTAPRAPNRAKA